MWCHHALDRESGRLQLWHRPAGALNWKTAEPPKFRRVSAHCTMGVDVPLPPDFQRSLSGSRAPEESKSSGESRDDVGTAGSFVVYEAKTV